MVLPTLREVRPSLRLRLPDGSQAQDRPFDPAQDKVPDKVENGFDDPSP